MNQKKIGVVRAFVLYLALLVIAYFISPTFLSEFERQVILACKWYIIATWSALFLAVYFFIKIIYFELLYRPGRRLLAKEAQLKNEGIDFDHIREGDAS